jgi:hypothetical protein
MTDQRKLAVDLFNHTWTLLDNNKRTKEQDEEMVHAAHASRHHWGIAGTEQQQARGEWQISRVYAALKRFAAAAHHAQLYMNACKMHDFDDWDLPFAHEGLARAMVKNDPAAAKKHIAEARKLGESIAKDGDRDWLYTNLDEISTSLYAT